MKLGDTHHAADARDSQKTIEKSSLNSIRQSNRVILIALAGGIPMSPGYCKSCSRALGKPVYFAALGDHTDRKICKEGEWLQLTPGGRVCRLNMLLSVRDDENRKVKAQLAQAMTQKQELGCKAKAARARKSMIGPRRAEERTRREHGHRAKKARNHATSHRSTRDQARA